MALLFDADGEQVDHGSATGIDSIAAGTVLFIFRPSAVTGNHHLYRKNGTQFSRFLYSSAGNLELGIERSGVDCTALTTGGPVTANVWQVAACTWTLAGANGDQHIYHGAINGALTEQSYASQVVGDGTHDNSAGTWIVGHNGINGAGAFRGVIARQQVWTRQLTLAEIKAAVYGGVSDWELYAEYGFTGTGTQPDLSGHGHHGTVTGATQALTHAPLALPGEPFSVEDPSGGVGAHPTLAEPSPINFPPELETTLRRRRNPLLLR